MHSKEKINESGKLCIVPLVSNALNCECPRGAEVLAPFQDNLQSE